jgi:hypothetical protein
VAGILGTGETIMTKAQLTQATTRARQGNLSHVDDSILHGLYLPTFKHPVYTTIEIVARLLSDFIQFNGQWDSMALNEFAAFAKDRIRII